MADTASTPTDIYDRLRGLGRPRPRPTQLAALLLLPALALVGCGVPLSTPETRVCGTVADVPIRVQDSVCRGEHADDLGTVVDGGSAGPVRWYLADRRCLDADDATGLGESLDDDYLGESCDPPGVVVVAPPRRSAPSTVTTTPRTVPPAAPTAAPRTSAPQTSAPQTPSPRVSTAKPSTPRPTRSR